MANQFFETQHDQILTTFREDRQINRIDAWTSLYQKLPSQSKRWTITLEQLNKEFITESINLEKFYEIKNILKIYKSLTQNENTESLNLILKFYIDKIEKKFDDQMKNKTFPDNINDIDIQDQPEDMLVFGLSPAQKKSRDQIKGNMKMRLECYKAVIETVKSNSRCLDLLRSTIKKCLDFLEKYNRKVELGKFVYQITLMYGYIKNNYHEFKKRQPTFIDISNKDNQTIHLEIRFELLRLCKQMNLGQMCLKVMEDVKCLIKERQNKKDETKKRFISMYYENLSEIFWNSSYYNFHAIFFMHHFDLFVKYSDIGQDTQNIQEKADKVALSILSIPFNATDLVLSREKFNKIKEFILEASKYIPNQNELIKALKSKNIIDLCSPEVQDLYNLLSADNINIFTISKQFKSFATFLQTQNSQLYALIQQRIIFKVVQQLSQVYTNLKISRLMQIIDFVSETKLVSLILEASQNSSLNCNIDFNKNIIQFGKTNRIESSSGSLCLFAERSKRIELKIQPTIVNQDRHLLEVKQYLESAPTKIADRLKSIKKLKLELRSIQNKEDNEEEYQQQLLEEMERKKKERLEARKVALQKQKEMKKTEHLRIINVKIEEIMKIKNKQIAKIGGIKIEDLSDEDKSTLDVETLVNLKKSIEEAQKNDVDDRAKKMFLRFDYRSRELRQNEITCINDLEVDNEEAKIAIEQAKIKFDQNKTFKEQIAKTRIFKEKFFGNVLKMRQKKFEEHMIKFKEFCEEQRESIQIKSEILKRDQELREQEAQEEIQRRKDENLEDLMEQNEQDNVWRRRGEVVDTGPVESDEEEKQDFGFKKGGAFTKGGDKGGEEEKEEKKDFGFKKGAAIQQEERPKEFGFRRGAGREEPQADTGAWGKGGVISQNPERQQRVVQAQKEESDGWNTVGNKKATTSNNNDFGSFRNKNIVNNNNNENKEVKKEFGFRKGAGK